MNFRLISRVIGFFLAMLSLTMFLPIIWAAYFEEIASLTAFFKSMIAGLLTGAVLISFGIKAKSDFFRKEGLATVCFAWIAAGLLGSLPFYFSGAVPCFTDCWFEAISGFTTTGSTTLVNIEALPKSILFWRSFTQWIGGMGIILLFIAVFPALGIGSKQMYKMELPGLGYKNLVPEIKRTAMILWSIYLVLSLLEITILKIAGMSFYDSLCHTFSTLSTGGFSTKNASIAHYTSTYIHLTIILFMFLGGTNFALYFSMIKGNYKTIYRDIEFRTYVGILLAASVIVTADLMLTETYTSMSAALKDSAFQVVSMQTTTGFVTADFNLWPSFSRILLVILMIVGASTGSTGGGSKVLRVILLAKYLFIQVEKFIRPNVVKVLKIGNIVIEDDTKDSVLGFYAIFVFFFLFSTLVMAALGLDIISAVTSVIATMWNIGPGLERVGALENYSFIHPAGKILLSMGMIMGRLELYTFLAILVPRFWKE